MGLAPSLVAVSVAGVLLLTLVRNELGEAATARRDHLAARDHFTANRWLGAVEPWIAPYNEGVATLRAGEHDDALEVFLVALRSVPSAEECRVLHNIAVTREGAGDLVDGRGDSVALKLYRQGRAALADGRCLERTDLSDALRASVLETDARLVEKVHDLLLRQEREALAELSPDERALLEESERHDARAQQREQRIAERREERPRRSDPSDSEEPEAPAYGW